VTDRGAIYHSKLKFLVIILHQNSSLYSMTHEHMRIIDIQYYITFYIKMCCPKSSVMEDFYGQKFPQTKEKCLAQIIRTA